MSRFDRPLSVLIGEAETRTIQEALKPRLRAAGVSTIEDRLNKPRRFFQNARLRGSLRLTDFLAVCDALDLDPAQLISTALQGNIPPETRPPAVLLMAWEQIRQDRKGIGRDRIQQLQDSLPTDPGGTRIAIEQELPRAAPDEVPLLLGLSGSALRLQTDLARAALLLKEAREIARELNLSAIEADLLIRLSYVALENNNLPQAIRFSDHGIVLFARLDDRIGQGRAFLARGTFQFYRHDYHEALQDFQATIRRSTVFGHLAAAHQGSAFSWIELKNHDEARRAAAQAQKLRPHLPAWKQANLSWLDARLSSGAERIEHLQVAQAILCPYRPADCVQVTVELIEAALDLDDEALAIRETTGLCALIEQTGANPRVQQAVMALIRHQTRLTPQLVAKIRTAIDRARAQRLSHLLNPTP